jgi:MFS family permease
LSEPDAHPESPAGEASAGSLPVRRRIGLLLGLAVYWGYLVTLNGAASPFLARSFGLDDARIAWLFAWMSLEAIPTFALMRLADRRGRRRVLRAAVTALPFVSLLAALAPGQVSFVCVQILRGALTGALNATIVVVVAEVLPTESRARGQALNGIGGSLGAGLALVAVSSLASVPGSWRWAWAGGALALPLVPMLRRALPETERYERAAARGETEHVPMLAVFADRYRRRAIARVASFFISNVATAAAGNWLFYHAVRTRGMAPGLVTGALIGGGAVGILGFPFGARAADRFGRRATVTATSIVATIGAIGYYALPLDTGAGGAALLGLLFAGISATSNAALTAGRAQAAELMPTRLRGAFMGWLTVTESSSALVSQAAAGALALALGGLGPAIVALQVLVVPALVIYLVGVPETAGLALEVAALEELPTPPPVPLEDRASRPGDTVLPT